MPVLFQKIIRREDLRRNPDVLYVFGDNMMRKGMGGQAGAMRGEPNAVGVVTKTSPSQCFSPMTADVLAQKRQIDRDMSPLYAHVNKGGVVVWPSDGIGTGLADLENKSPETFDYIKSKLRGLIEASRIASL